MAHAALSPEARLPVRLKGLNCSLRSFCAITGLSLATLSRVLNGERSFTATEIEHTEETINLMVDLQREVNALAKMPLPVDWSRPEAADCIVIRKTAALAREEGKQHLDAVAATATLRVAGQ